MNNRKTAIYIMLFFAISLILLLIVGLSYLYYEDYRSKIYSEQQYKKACSLIESGADIRKVEKKLREEGFIIDKPQQHYNKSYIMCTWPLNINYHLQGLIESIGIPSFDYPTCVIIYFDENNKKVIEFSPYL